MAINTKLFQRFMHLVCCIKVSPPFPSQFQVSARFITIFIEYFPVTFFRYSLVSSTGYGKLTPFFVRIVPYEKGG
jgi:hypothetical protein